jgi:hypothetical protein
MDKKLRLHLTSEQVALIKRGLNCLPWQNDLELQRFARWFEHREKRNENRIRRWEAYQLRCQGWGGHRGLPPGYQG